MAVAYWRMPLSLICDEFADAGFVLERIHEPRPAPSMRELHPEHAAELDTNPGFIVFALRRS